MSNNPYGMTATHWLDRETRLEWFRYEAANAAAKEAYDARVVYTEEWSSCLVCEEPTSARNGIHEKCRGVAS